MPTDFRRVLDLRYGQELFVTSVEGESALIYPLSVWEEIEARLAAVPSTDQAKVRYLERVSYFGQQVGVDTQGRILLPQLLRERAGMVGEVVVSGRIDHLEVWNHDRFLARLAERPLTEDDFRALAARGI